MPYALTNDKNWLMYNAAKQFTSTPDVKQAQQFATAARAENARYNLPKPLKNLGYHVQFVGMADAEPVDIDADIDPIELHDGIETIGAMLAGIVDGETLKPGVWYTVKNVEWVEM